MTQEQLQRGNEIFEKMKIFEDCIEALDGCKNDDLRVVVTDFLINWRNVGNGTIKSACAEIAFNAILEHLRKNKTDLQNEFNNL